MTNRKPGRPIGTRTWRNKLLDSKQQIENQIIENALQGDSTMLLYLASELERHAKPSRMEQLSK